MERQPRGHAIVISNRYFLKDNLEVRDGAEFDEVNICSLFTRLHFNVCLHSNKTAEVRFVSFALAFAQSELRIVKREYVGDICIFDINVTNIVFTLECGY